MKALVGAFNQEKALAGSFSMIVKTGCGTDGSFHLPEVGVEVGGRGADARAPHAALLHLHLQHRNQLELQTEVKQRLATITEKAFSWLKEAPVV